MAELRPHIPEIRAAGGELVIVGSGAPFFARAFREDLNIPDVPILCDQELVSYRTAKMRRDRQASFNPRIALHAVRALAKGHMQHRRQGDAAQMGGVLVVRPDGTIVYRFIGETAGHHPPPRAIVEAVQAAARG